MHGITTINRINREAAEAARIVKKHKENPAQTQAQEAAFKAHVSEAKQRLEAGRTAA